MARTAIQPSSLRDPRPAFTTAWKVGNTIYLAGQTASEPPGRRRAGRHPGPVAYRPGAHPHDPRGGGR